MKLVKNIVLFSLTISFFTPLLAIKTEQDSDSCECKIKKVVRSNWFKVGLGVATIGGLGGIVWLLKKRIADFVKSTPEKPTVQPSTSPLEMLDVLEIKKTISDNIGEDTDLLGFSIKSKGLKSPLHASRALEQDWEGYSVYFTINATANKENERIKVQVFYKDYDRLEPFVDAMNQLLDSKNISADNRDYSIQQAHKVEGKILYSAII